MLTLMAKNVITNFCLGGGGGFSRLGRLKYEKGIDGLCLSLYELSHPVYFSSKALTPQSDGRLQGDSCSTSGSLWHTVSLTHAPNDPLIPRQIAHVQCRRGQVRHVKEVPSYSGRSFKNYRQKRSGPSIWIYPVMSKVYVVWILSYKFCPLVHFGVLLRGQP